ncbi:hypothetical protein D9Q98_005331 [Chlorella vulgaris]|uniref:Corrinoid adenosyltransferase MMAB n=1 Tax=Chlorella vulgaris TaxID=3077 RepID=A0A9D4YVR6_CHLVU|nr:hypothetical protein D9Q98_005331 [Chlorella vulgaris]
MLRLASSHIGSLKAGLAAFRELGSSAALHTTGSSWMKIYTKTGDKGSSSLYSGERRPKDDAVFAALGDVDEVNSTLGLAREHARHVAPQLAGQLESIQSRLFDVGSAVATPRPTSSDHKLQRVAFGEGHSEQLEGWIDGMMEELPPLTQFILPSGGLAAATLHMARSVCRRAERAVVPLVRDQLTDAAVGIYLNRLSDYLFTAARYAALKGGEEETVWVKAPQPAAAPPADS